nr:protein translocase subunit SecD [uncultured Ottowia sp.]
MNRYPLWKYALIAVSLLISVIYTLPNLYGEAPAVQVSAGKMTVKVDGQTLEQVEKALQEAGITADSVAFDGQSVRARFDTEDTQIKAKDVIARALAAGKEEGAYIVALNLVSRSPDWLTALHAKPMYLGLDLRGGVHFMLQVDMRAAITKRLDTTASDIRMLLRQKDIRHGGVSRSGDAIEVRMRDANMLDAARRQIAQNQPQMDVAAAPDGSRLTVTFKPAALHEVQEQAIKQNITTLHNRVNELGVAEPVIQQQGADRVVVQLPGVQDTAKAKDILGRTATLEMRLVDESAEGRAAEGGTGPVPFGSERFMTREGHPVIVKREVILTGDSLDNAQPGFDENQRPSVDLVVDAKGGQIMRDTSRRNLKKRMAIVLFEKGKGEVLTAPVIEGELGNRFRISGSMSVNEANDLALLLRAGSLAAPMEIVEERTIGPSLGKENIAKGFKSVMWGFAVIVVFMSLYYMMFGVFSSIALAFNLLLLVAILSMLQATLTLPGMAAMALALGMAIDANVLINERIREELRNGSSPQAAISAGYQHAWATILDSNVTSLIAGLALLAFGSGPVRGFAVVHCIGILTSMFSGVFFSRGLVNLWYGRRKRLKTVSIGTVWRPETAGAAGALAPRETSGQ